MRLKDKICIVTGAGQGIGRASAYRLGVEGGTIVVAERVEETAAETVRQLTNAGRRAHATIADLSILSECERLMEDTVARYGRIDVLANVVGGTIWWQPYHLYSEEQIYLELHRSLYTTLWCCRAVLPHMIRQKAGAVINLSSNVTDGGLYRAPYATAKGGIDALTRTLANENGRYGIRVNAVAPGSTAISDRVTPRLMLRHGETAAAAYNTDVYIDEARNADVGALRRQGTVQEQAAVVAFLASEDASYITGQIINCTGRV